MSLQGSPRLLSGNPCRLRRIHLLLQSGLLFLSDALGFREPLRGNRIRRLARFLAGGGFALSALLALEIEIGLGLGVCLGFVEGVLLFKFSGDGVRLLALPGGDLAADLGVLLGRDFLFAPRTGLVIDVQMRGHGLAEG